MLAEGTLPVGYTVRKRKLVKAKAAGVKAAKQAGKRKSKKGRLPEAA
jgi:hypothetical protein